MKKAADALEAAAKAAEAAQRSLAQRLAQAEEGWKDRDRQKFETEHLAGVRAEAQHLQLELSELTRLARAVAKDVSSG